MSDSINENIINRSETYKNNSYTVYNTSYKSGQ
jgi:hypothetical protein